METIYELQVKIIADAKELEKALNQTDKAVKKTGKDVDKEAEKLQKAFKEVGKTFTVVGAAITIAMGGIIKSFVSAGSELHDLSLMTGLTVKTLAGLKYAAEQNGASISSVQIAVRTLANTMNDASDGLETATRSFKKLNLDVKDLKSLNPEELFMKVASAIAEVPDPMQRSALAVDMFGRSGTALLPMLSQGAEGLKKMTEEGIKLSGWTTEGANQADALGDSLTTLKTAMGGAFNTIASSVAPAIKDLAEKITNVIVKITEWTKQHPELTRTLTVFTSTLGIGLTLVGSMLLIVPKLVTAFRNLQIIMGTAAVSAKALWGSLLIIPAVIAAITAIYSKLQSQWSKDVLTPQEIGWAKLEKTMERTDGRLKGFSDHVKVYTMEQAQYYKKLGYSVELYAGKVEETTEEIIENLESEADKAKELKWITEALTKVSENRAKQAQKNHSILIDNLEDEYNAQLKILGLEEDEATRVLRNQIDALNKQTETEEQALEDSNFEKERKNLRYLLNIAEDQKEWERLKEQLTELEARHERDLLLRQRNDQIDALQEEIDKVRDTYAQKREQLKGWYDTQKTTLDKSLEDELERIDEATKALELAYGVREKETLEHIAKMQEIINSLQDKVVTIYLQEIASGVSGAIGGGAKGGIDVIPPPPGSTPPGTPGSIYGSIYGYAQGGIVTQPTLAMVGEHGKEAIIPEHDWGMMGGVNITFTQPVYLEREDQINSLANKINQAIQRNNRLRFGSAYSG